MLSKTSLFVSLKEANSKKKMAYATLRRLTHPSVATLEQRRKLYIDLLEVFGKVEGKRSWCEYLRSLKADICLARRNLTEATEEVYRWRRIIKFHYNLKFRKLKH